MLHLILDTSVYRSTPRLDSKEFTLLARLAESGQAVIHVPYVVEREFATELDRTQRQRITEAVRALSRALAFTPLGPRSTKLAEQLSALRSDLPDLVAERSGAFLNWLDSVSAVRHPLTQEQAVNAMDAYFSGRPPLTQPKSRKDIPDSFIFQKVIELHAAHGSDLGAVVADKALRSALEDVGIRCWPALRDFFTSQVGQSLVAEDTIRQHRDGVWHHILTLVQQRADKVRDSLEQALSSNDHSTLRGDHFPGDAGEIHVSGVDAPHQVDIDTIEYLGDTFFVVEITAFVELLYDFPISNFEAFELDDDRVSLGPLNDHYFEAETTDTFRFAATLELAFPEWETPPKDLAELLDLLKNPTIGVDDLRDFEIVDEHATPRHPLHPEKPEAQQFGPGSPQVSESRACEPNPAHR